MKDQILALREQGLTYNQIKAELGCAKSTISYYCGIAQKEKAAIRLAKRREDKLLHKYQGFKYASKGLNNKFTLFKGRGLVDFDYTYEDVVKIANETTTCYLCNDLLDYEDPSSYHFDHKLPLSRGGLNTLDNLGIACRSCNFGKHDLTVEEFIELCSKVVKHNSPFV